MDLRAEREQQTPDSSNKVFRTDTSVTLRSQSHSNVVNEIKEEVEKHFKEVSDKKTKSKILAAKRCLWTNAAVGSVFVAALVSVWAFSRTSSHERHQGVDAHPHAIADIGTIQSVISSCLEAARESWHRVGVESCCKFYDS